MSKTDKEVYLKSELNKRIEKVIEWGEQRDLYKYSSPLAQAFKLAEEVGELISAFNRDNQAELKNAIGDSLVVALHLLHFAGRDSITTLIFDKKPKKIGEKIAELLVETGFLIERLYEADIKNLTAYYLNIEAFIANVCQVAEQLDVNPVECLDEVLQEIKSRKGRFNELGIFIKEGEND